MKKILAFLCCLTLCLSALPGALAENMPDWEYPLAPEIIYDFEQYITLANRTHLLDGSYTPNDLVNVTVKRASGTGHMQLRQAASDALTAMFEAASEAGYTLYTAGWLKKTPNRNYVFIDGGMADNIRPALYQAKYDAFIAGKEGQEKTTEYTIAGKCCESGDILIESIQLPEIQTGDLLVLKSTGAYGYSMASHYNKSPLPAVVFAAEGKSRIVIQRETFEHLISLEI